MYKKYLSITEYFEKIILDQKGQEWLGSVKGLNIFYSMKYSIQFAKLDLLLNLLLFSCASSDNSKRLGCAWRAFGTRKSTYSRQVKLESQVLTIHLREGDFDLQTPHCLVVHPWLVEGQHWYHDKSLSFQYFLIVGQHQGGYPAVKILASIVLLWC